MSVSGSRISQKYVHLFDVTQVYYSFQAHNFFTIGENTTDRLRHEDDVLRLCEALDDIQLKEFNDILQINNENIIDTFLQKVQMWMRYKLYSVYFKTGNRCRSAVGATHSRKSGSSGINY
jgi:hypothetical protein